MPVENLSETSHVLLFLEGVVVSFLSSSSSLCLCICVILCCIVVRGFFFWGGGAEGMRFVLWNWFLTCFDLFNLRMAAVQIVVADVNGLRVVVFLTDAC